ncbi:phage holin family protein [Amnibacterium endophyticum]|uniref:Phage holin family protein n=1 Tax=Amnibacterium endophyticum TaxID=2109337 RepID=A0ABW4LHV7_9MICO
MSDERGDGDGLSELAEQVGHDVSSLVDKEVATAKTELTETAKQGAVGAGLVGGAAVSGLMALLFGSIAVWRGLGNRIGFGKSAALVAALYGAGAVALSSGGAERITHLTGAPRTGRSLHDLSSAARSD